MKTFSLIIPTYQRPDDLAKCLDCLAPGNQKLSFSEYEVIVTDDEREGSESQKLVREQYPWAKWVAGPGQGPAANRNNGANYANGAWLVFTDDDCLPQEGWLDGYSKNLDKGFKVLEGATLPEGPRKSLAWYAPINKNGGKLWSCNIAVKKYFFNELNGFDEDYSFALEDLDFKKRVLKSNCKWKFIPTADVIHPWRESNAKEIYKRKTRELKGWKTFADKHPDVIKDFNFQSLLIPLSKIKNELFKNFKTHKCRGLVSYLAFITGSLINATIKFSFNLSSKN